MGGIKGKLLLSLLGSCAAIAIAAPAAQGVTQSAYHLSFGTQAVGTPAPAKAVTLYATCFTAIGSPPYTCTNPVAGTHTFGTPTITGDGFSLGAPNTCASGVLVTPLISTPASCVTTVNFTASSPGPKTGTLQFPALTVITLAGNGDGAVAPKGKKKRKKKGKKKRKKK